MNLDVKVTVMTPIYNGEKYLREMMDSVLAQTMQDFEWIIINDGSTDDTEKIVKSYNDPRIRYYANDGNKGISYSYNRAIELANSDFLAVAEADDISHPQRFAIQLSYMEAHTNVGVLGSRVRMFTAVNPAFKKIKPGRPIRHTPEQIKNGFVFSVHGTVHQTYMYRRDAFTLNNIKYDEKYKIHCDFSVGQKLICVTNMVSLPHVVLHYRIHDSNMSGSNKELSKIEIREIYREYILRELGFDLPKHHIRNWDEYTEEKFDEYVSMVELILSVAVKNPKYEPRYLRRAAAIRIYDYFKKARRQNGMSAKVCFSLYRKTPLLRHITTEQKIRIWLKYANHYLR